MTRSALVICLLLSLVSCRTSLKMPDCPEPQLSRDVVVRLVNSELDRRGLPQPRGRVRIKIRREGCDYLYRATGIPKRPGGYLFVKLSPAGEILTFMPGV